jgi:hypothetical protein
MASRIQHLLALAMRDLYGLKEFDRSPLKDRIEDVVHGPFFLCCYYNINMLHSQHKVAAAGNGEEARSRVACVATQP